MSLSKAYKTDSELEVNGISVPLDHAENADGSVPTFIIGRSNKTNKPYQKALTQAAAPFQRQIQLKVDVSAQLEKAFLDVFCNHILRGWSNVLMSDVTGNDGCEGRPHDKGFADFNKQNAIALFTRLPDVYEYLQEQSNTASLFLETVREESAKN